MLVCVYSNPINHRHNYSSSFPSIAVPLSETCVFLIEFDMGHAGQLSRHAHIWMQDFSYGHGTGLEAGLSLWSRPGLEAGLILWPLCRSGGKTFSYDHCAGLEAGLFLWPL